MLTQVGNNEGLRKLAIEVFWLICTGNWQFNISKDSSELSLTIFDMKEKEAIFLSKYHFEQESQYNGLETSNN